MHLESDTHEIADMSLGAMTNTSLLANLEHVDMPLYNPSDYLDSLEVNTSVPVELQELPDS